MQTPDSDFVHSRGKWRGPVRGKLGAGAVLAALLGIFANAYQIHVARAVSEMQLVALASETVRRAMDVPQTARSGAGGSEYEQKTEPPATRYVLERIVRQRISLRGFDASHATLTSAYLPNVDLRGARLHDALLLGADLSNADLGPYPPATDYARRVLGNRWDLRTDLRNADLTGAALTGANFSFALLLDAKLVDADLRRANFAGADLTGADLSGAALTGATNLTAAQLNSACGNCRTVLDHGYTIPECPPRDELDVESHSVPIESKARTSTEDYSQFSGEARGANVEDGVITGMLAALESISLDVELSENMEYRVIGWCDADCSDVDLAVFDQNGREVDSDYLMDDLPILNFRATTTATWRLEVSMVDCRVEPCGWAVQIRERELP